MSDADIDGAELVKRMRRAMGEYKVVALDCKARGEEEKFKLYRNSWCTLEAFLPVDPSEYW